MRPPLGMLHIASNKERQATNTTPDSAAIQYKRGRCSARARSARHSIGAPGTRPQTSPMAATSTAASRWLESIESAPPTKAIIPTAVTTAGSATPRRSLRQRQDSARTRTTSQPMSVEVSCTGALQNVARLLVMSLPLRVSGGIRRADRDGAPTACAVERAIVPRVSGESAPARRCAHAPTFLERYGSQILI
jgi:hypothetical protein